MSKFIPKGSAIVALSLVIVMVSLSLIVRAQNLRYPTQVAEFYRLAGQQPFWFTSPVAASVVRARFISALDSAQYYGLDKEKYHYAEIASESTITDSAQIRHLDEVYTDAAISYCKDIYEGTGMDKWVANDEISSRYTSKDDNFILGRLVAIKLVPDVSATLHSMEPQSPEYLAVKNELAKQLELHNEPQVAQLNVSVNFYRWIYHFHFDKFVLVNIPSGVLHYYEGGSILKLQMNVVVGKPDKQTPVLATWCNQVILYPYWNVPADIAVKEFLPKFKANPAKIDELNIQLIDSAGNVADNTAVNWATMTPAKFHYRLRQATGCTNSLGVIKFNLTDPFDVYMHDTNFKEAFAEKKHFLSHGCVRLENPIGLANLFIGDRMDETLVRSCVQGQDPIVNKLDKSIPVFIVYLMASVDSNNNVIYSKDIYHLGQ